MLATIGFIVAGLCFAVFAYTFDAYVVGDAKLKLKRFGYAYYLLALALMIWGVAAAKNDPVVLKNAVLAGDLLILIGSLLMLSVWLGTKRQLWLWLAAMVAIAAWVVRWKHYIPAPYMNDGVLVFNSQKPVAGALAAVFLLLWLPVNIKVARRVTTAIKQPDIESTYVGIYSAVTVAALLFLAARRPLTVALSFSAIIICFIMLIASNILVKKLKAGNGTAKHS